MSKPLEHDYIGLASENPSMDKSSEKISSSSSASAASSTLSSEKENVSSLNFKETELRLGLPGSDSLPPERKSGSGVSLFGKDLQNNHNNNNGLCSSSLKNIVAGAKRGFSDAIDGSSGKWVFSVSNNNGGSEADLGRGVCLFSPRGGNVARPSLVALEASTASEQNIKKEVGIVQEKKKPQVASATNDQATAPPAAK